MTITSQTILLDNWQQQSNIYYGLTKSPGSAPAAPSDFTAVAISDSQINLSFTDNSDNEDNFIFERSLDGVSGWVQVISNAANTTSATNTGLTASTQYFYRLRAVNAFGNSAWVESNATTQAAQGNATLLFSEDFNTSPLGAPWYDDAATSYLQGTNPDDSSNTYRYQWLSGEIGTPLAQTARRQFTATDTIDLEFDFGISTNIVGNDGDHCIYFKLATDDVFAPPGSGFTFYVQSQANGQVDVEWRLSDGTWDANASAQNSVTVGAPSIHSATPRTVRIVATMNTVGQLDGSLVIYVDGTEYINRTDCIFRLNASEQFGQIIIGPELQSTQTATVNMDVDNLSLYDGVRTQAPPGEGVYPDDPTRQVEAGSIFVATTGSDITGDGSIGNPFGPLPDYAMRQVTVPGTKVYMRGGTYTPTAEVSMATGYIDGTAGNWNELTGYPGEDVYIDCSAVRGGETSSWFLAQDVAYWRFSHMRLENYVNGFYLSYNEGSDNIHVHSIYGQTDETGDNIGLVVVYGGTTNFNISRVYTRNGVGGFTNTGAIHIDDANHVNTGLIEYCDLQGASFGIYHKHEANNVASNDQRIIIRNCIMNDNFRTSAGHNQAGIYYQHCIFGSVILLSESDGGPAGDWNWFDHCTFAAGIYLRDQTGGGDAQPGAQNNRLTNCVVSFMQIFNSGASVTQNSDYNFFGADIRDQFDSVDYSFIARDLASWQAANSSDANSVQGTIEFTGTDMSLPASYALAVGSPGIGAAEGGADMGADVSRVGVFAV